MTEAELMGIAQGFAKRKLARGRKLTQPALVFEYLQVLFQGYEHEVFSVLFLDTQHRVIRFETLLHGTLDSASVYPHEVVKRALAHNAGAVVLVHNHPSGDPEPSEADRPPEGSAGPGRHLGHRSHCGRERGMYLLCEAGVSLNANHGITPVLPLGWHRSEPCWDSLRLQTLRG